MRTDWFSTSNHELELEVRERGVTFSFHLDFQGWKINIEPERPTIGGKTSTDQKTGVGFLWESSEVPKIHDGRYLF